MLFTLKNKATNRPPPAAGRIRPGTKKLTPNAAKNPAIVRIFDDGMARGLSYPAIAAAIEKQTQVKGALMPMNSRFYRILTGDFPLGSSVPESLKKRYGVVVEGETVFEQIPIMFAANSVDQMIFARYQGSVGVERRESRVVGDALHCFVSGEAPKGRKIIPMIEMKDMGSCVPEACNWYDEGKCKHKSSFAFYVPGVETALPFVMETGSPIASEAVWLTLKNIQEQIGTIPLMWEKKPIFFLGKRQERRAHYSKGVREYVLQWVPYLGALQDLALILSALTSSPVSAETAQVLAELSAAPELMDADAGKGALPNLNEANPEAVRDALKEYWKRTGAKPAERQTFASALLAGLFGIDENWTVNPVLCADVVERITKLDQPCDVSHALPQELAA